MYKLIKGVILYKKDGPALIVEKLRFLKVLMLINVSSINIVRNFFETFRLRKAVRSKCNYVSDKNK